MMIVVMMMVTMIKMTIMTIVIMVMMSMIFVVMLSTTQSRMWIIIIVSGAFPGAPRHPSGGSEWSGTENILRGKTPNLVQLVEKSCTTLQLTCVRPRTPIFDIVVILRARHGRG